MRSFELVTDHKVMKQVTDLLNDGGPLSEAVAQRASEFPHLQATLPDAPLVDPLDLGSAAVVPTQVTFAARPFVRLVESADREVIVNLLARHLEASGDSLVVIDNAIWRATDAFVARLSNIWTRDEYVYSFVHAASPDRATLLRESVNRGKSHLFLAIETRWPFREVPRTGRIPVGLDQLVSDAVAFTTLAFDGEGVVRCSRH